MKIRQLLCVACLTSVFACGGDDSEDETGADSTDTDPTATMTDPTATMTDPTATMTDPTATMTDPTATVTDTDPTATVTDTDPTATVTDTDPTADSSSGTDDSGSSSDTGGDPACEEYCTGFFEVCNDCKGVDGLDPYADMGACLTACAGFPPDDGMAMGGTDLECRAYHLSMAACEQGNPHCAHADADGSGVCGG